MHPRRSRSRNRHFDAILATHASRATQGNSAINASPVANKDPVIVDHVQTHVSHDMTGPINARINGQNGRSGQKERNVRNGRKEQSAQSAPKDPSALNGRNVRTARPSIPVSFQKKPGSCSSASYAKKAWL